MALLGLVMTLGFSQWAIQFGSICLLIGLYREMEEKSFSIFLASAVAVLTTLAANLLIIIGYARLTGLDLYGFLTKQAQPLVTQLQEMPQFKEVTLEMAIWYLPAAFVITLMIVIFVSLTAVTRFPTTEEHSQSLRLFRLPDWSIWFFIAGLGGTCVKTGIDWIPLASMNILAVSLTAYFFQGLAVFTHLMDRLKIFGFWRMLAYFLAVFQFFIFISGLGILDYWFDFRQGGQTGSQNENFKRSIK
jgi:hypothetical protein